MKGQAATETHPLYTSVGDFVAGLKEDITVLSIHPGWVKTDMGGSGADIDVATSVKGIADVLEAKAGSKTHEYLDYRGETIPW